MDQSEAWRQLGIALVQHTDLRAALANLFNFVILTSNDLSALLHDPEKGQDELVDELFTIYERLGDALTLFQNTSTRRVVNAHWLATVREG